MATGDRLIVPRGSLTAWVKKHYARERIVTLPDGRRARVWVDDSGTVQQTETDHTLDALVRPKTVRIQIRSRP